MEPSSTPLYPSRLQPSPHPTASPLSYDETFFSLFFCCSLFLFLIWTSSTLACRCREEERGARIKNGVGAGGGAGARWRGRARHTRGRCLSFLAKKNQQSQCTHAEKRSHQKWSLSLSLYIDTWVHTERRRGVKELRPSFKLVGSSLLVWCRDSLERGKNGRANIQEKNEKKNIRFLAEIKKKKKMCFLLRSIDTGC